MHKNNINVRWLGLILQFLFQNVNAVMKFKPQARNKDSYLIWIHFHLCRAQIIFIGIPKISEWLRWYKPLSLYELLSIYEEYLYTYPNQY